jgi:putative ABC transport system permease protein
VLLFIAIMATTTTLTLGLVVRGVATDPYQTTREATAGPDVVANAGAPEELASLEALTDAPGVVRHSGPHPVASAVLKADGRKADVQAVGRDTSPASVDQPQLTQGSWVREGGVVVEAAFADALGLSAGDSITLNRRSFQVLGVAVTAAVPLYPEVSCLAGQCVPGVGLVWLTRADARSLAPEALGYVVNLKLADPDAAQAFVNAHLNHPPAPVGMSWRAILDTNAGLVGNQRRALLTGSWLLALLAVASVAVLVGGRMAGQIRRVGLLKAVGGTPSLVTAVLLAEYIAVAVLAVAAGLAAGWLVAPLLTDPGAGVLGSAGAPPLTMSTVGLVTAVALGVAVVAIVVPAIRASRTSTVLALANSARPPRRTAWLIALSSQLPVPLLLGLRVAARRPRRTLLCAASVAITVSGIVAALGAHADLKAQRLTVDGSRADQLNDVLLVITITLVALTAVNAIFITWATALDTRRSSALARALGATPHDVSAGLSAAQVFPALLGAILGIPGGIGLLAAVDPDGATIAPVWQLIAVVAVTVLAIAGLTAIPALTSGRRPTAEVLESELA